MMMREYYASKSFQNIPPLGGLRCYCRNVVIHPPPEGQSRTELHRHGAGRVCRAGRVHHGGRAGVLPHGIYGRQQRRFRSRFPVSYGPVCQEPRPESASEETLV